MKTKTKALILCLCAVLLVVASVLGTMAYLSDDDTVTNTFTVGKVKIKLDEAQVKEDGTLVSDYDNRVQTNQYHLLPGHTYIKDPTVTVLKDSEDAYVRMMVTVENIDDLKDALPDSGVTAKYYAGDGTFLLQMLCVDADGDSTWNDGAWVYNGYTESEDHENGTYEFRYAGYDTAHPGVVKKSDSNTELSDLFESITVPAELDNNSLDFLKYVKIVVTAHAIQADGFDGADDAWQAFDAN